MKIVLIHGFNVRDGGKGSIDKLKPFLQDAFPVAEIDTDQADYGWHFLIRANFLSWMGSTIDRIANALKDADLVICHSNGANYCMKALLKICNKKIKVCMLSPALNRKYPFNESFNKCLVMHSQDDKTVSLAKYVPFSRWGDMGKVGAYTDDMRVKNMPHKDYILHHSDWFVKSCIEQVKNSIVAFQRGEL